MTDRVTLARAARMGSMSLSRGTLRSPHLNKNGVDCHLLQECEELDVHYSETHSNRGAPLEIWEPLGITHVALKQQKDDQKQTKQSSSSDDGQDWNQNQPQGPAAEAMVSYVGGSRSHPVAKITDRRVRPYAMKEGEGAHYAPDGSEQMTFFNENGAYLVSLDGASVKDKENKRTRFASLRHVTKDMQTHKIDDPEKVEAYPHEGKTVNTEVRCTAGRIEFRVGDDVVGYYDKAASTWYFKGKIAQMEFTDKISEKVGSSEVEIKPSVVNVKSLDVILTKKTWLGQGDKDQMLGEKVVTEAGPSAVVKAPLA